MNTHWHYVVAGVTYGPVPIETLQQMWASGTVGPSDLVAPEGQAHWQRAGQVFLVRRHGSPMATTDVPASETDGLAALASAVEGAKGGGVVQRPTRTSSPRPQASAGRPVVASVVLAVLGFFAINAIVHLTTPPPEPPGPTEAEKAQIMREQGYQGTDEELARTADTIAHAKEYSREKEERRRKYRLFD